MVKKLILAMALLGMLAPFAFGQGAGQIVGSVKDPSQGSIPNVTVTVTEAGTGQARSMVTGSDGAVRVPGLAAHHLYRYGNRCGLPRVPADGCACCLLTRA